MTDYQGNNVVGTSKVAVKINGVTLKDANNNTVYYTITNGIIDLNINNIPKANKYNNITIVTREKTAYNSATNTTNKINIES